MSLATNIKEFADILHNIYAQQLSSVSDADLGSDGILSLAVPKIVVLQQACIYLGKQIFSFLSFQWLRDFSYFPLLSQEIGSSEKIMTDTFLSEPASYLFSFSKNGVSLSSPKQGFFSLFSGFLKSDCLLTGVINSFFFSLPLSLPHFITLRRMFSQGIAAAIASIFGTVAAHSLLLLGVIYGIRFLVIPYYSLQPLAFLIGIVVMAIVITEFVKEKRMYLVPLNHYPSLIRIGIINFVVALCESATVFHDLYNLTLNQQTSYLQLYSPLHVQSFALQATNVVGANQSALNSFFLHATYLIAFILGHATFSFLFCYVILKANEKLCSLTGWTLPRTASRINKGLLITILTLTFSTFPYYGLDYLLTKSAGFLPEDPALSNTLFSPTQLRSRNRHFKSRAPATKNSKTVLELDVNYFDRGMYLNAPKEEKHQNIGENTSSPESLASYDPALSFEELNYQGEAAWLMRHERARRLPEEQDSKKPSIFQKPKSHFKELRVEQDNKQVEAALKERPQIGAISESKEGITPEEKLFALQVQTSSVHQRCKQSGALQRTRQSESRVVQRENPSFNFNSLVKGGDNTYTCHEHGEAQVRALVKELYFDKEIASNYEKSFTSPFGEESDGTPPDLLPVENIIKKRYRLNPVYRALLQSDIDSFMSRQPSEYKITQNREVTLSKKRQLLENYYNSIQYYSPVETTLYATQIEDQSKNAFVARTKPPFVNHERGLVESESAIRVYPKSFGEMLYHQQFKGTLTTVKKFFKLSFDEQLNTNKNTILSYDQPLYKNRESIDKKYHPSLHEELSLEEISSFIKESNSAPIYAGWNEKARQFVITNRFNFIE